MHIATTTPTELRPPHATPMLSKSRFVSGLQCRLRLWHDVHDRELAGAASAAQTARFDSGHRVGALATERHAGGRLIAIEHRDHDLAVAETRALMADRTVPALFEAAFTHRGVRIRADILARVRGGRWDLIEVKSTLSPKDVHLDDLALQLWVLEGRGIDVRRAGILTLARDYVYDGEELDVDALFVLHDQTKLARERAGAISPEVRSLLTMLRREAAPEVAIGEHCQVPYPCPYYESCTRDLELPEHPLDELPGLRPMKRAALAESGAVDVRDLGPEVPLSALQRRVRDAVVEQRELVSDGLAGALREVVFPVHHLDFETFAPAVPRYRGTRPYQTLPFQWSNHIEHAGGRVEHHEYLSTEDSDPRETLARTLLASLGRRGTICTYSGYEARIIRELAEALPEHATRLRALLSRTWDLLQVIREHYYHPAFHGSFSIKQVLPVLVPHLDYADLDIRDGQDAASAYADSLAMTDAEARGVLQRALRRYCERDTVAMLELRRALSRRA